MTPEQFLKSKGLGGYADKFLMPQMERGKFKDLLHEYANLQKPEWIPIIDGDLSGLPDGLIWITYNLPDNTPFVSKQNGAWLKEMEAIFVAWMPYTEPKPYQP